MDLFRPVAYLSIRGSKYGLVIVDDFSRFTWVFFLQDKTETQGTLKCFLRRAQNEFELKVKKIRSDNGSEFKNLQVEEYLEEEGIKHEFSAPYTPQQNGVVERKNRTLIDMARTMLGEFKTPERFWLEAVNTACHAINRVYLHRLLKKTSYELLTGNKPNVSYFRVFGSKCYILVKSAFLNGPIKTGLSGGAPDCPVSQRPPVQRSAAKSTGDAWPAPTVSRGHRTVRCAPGSVRCANQPEDPMVGYARNGRRSAPDMLQWLSGGAPDCSVRHPTEGNNCLPCWVPTTPNCLGAINGTPRRMEE
jgi:hypothetical protein